jgi:iron complex outermembrane receptor protein
MFRSLRQNYLPRLCLLVWLGAAMRGQTGPAALKSLSLEELSQIEVTSPSKEPTPAFRSPVAIYVITNEDIQRSGVTTIPDALRLAPGVEVAQIDGSKWSIGIRGFGTRLSRSVLVLIDGRTVYTTLFAGTYWEVQDTLLEDIARIEVIRGPGGSIWGPNAVDGVINIITKSTKDTKGVFASAGGGNVEQGFFNFRYGGGSDSGLTYRVYAKGFTRDAEEHPDHDNFDAWRGVQGGFRMDWTGGDRDAFTLQGDIYKQKDGEQVSATNYSPPSTQNVNGYETASGGNVLFRWTRTLRDGNNVQLQAYYDRTNDLEPNIGENRDSGDVDFLERTRWGRQELLYGAGARVVNGRFDEVTSGLVFFPFHQTDYLISAFLEDDINLVNNKLMLNLGSKLLRTNYTGVNFEPSVRLMWTPTDKQTFWASYTHALRTPSDAEDDFYLSSMIGETPNGTPLFARFNANRKFAPEQLNGYEVGFRQLIGKNVYLDLAGFFNHYHDLFSEDITGGFSVQTTLPFPAPAVPPSYVLLPAQFQNGLYGATYGGEIAPEWRPTKFWRLRGSYSFLRVSMKQAPTGSEIGLGATSDNGSSPQHQTSFDSSFDVSKKVQLDFIFRYVSTLPDQKVRAYSTGDARIGYRLSRHLGFSLVGRNLFQPSHAEYLGDPSGLVGIRRSVYASLYWVSK